MKVTIKNYKQEAESFSYRMDNQKNEQMTSNLWYADLHKLANLEDA